MITLAKNPFYSKNRIMEKEINIKSALEYYLLAGVDETVGDRPFEFGSETVKVSPAPVVLPRPAPVQTAAPARQAPTELAQATATACKTPMKSVPKPKRWKNSAKLWKILKAVP